VEVLNGSGEVFGREFVDEMGMLDGPIMVTGSFNVARVADAVISEATRRLPEIGRGGGYVHPLVAECSDAALSDLVGRPMGEAETLTAWSNASDGPLAEGSVGAGTGFVSFQFKAGIGTSSRRVQLGGERYTVGALVATNTGPRENLRIDGVPVGRILRVPKPSWVQQGSIIMVLASDAPLLQRQLSRLARRAHLGLARVGGTAHNGSGDFAIAFSTGNRYVLGETLHDLHDVDNGSMSSLFDAAVEAVEESIVNALCAATEIVGRDGNVAPVLPLPELAVLLKQYHTGGSE
jgi:D-aminopeptidase